MSDKKFGIIGAGIGGLTLAIALQRKGFDVTVYENAAELKPVGAGLALAANAVKALIDIGIDKEVLEKGKVIRSMFVKDHRGNVLAETDSVKLSEKLGVVNNFTIHRADLHKVLTDLLSPGTIQLNKGCVNIEQDRSGVTIQFSDNTSARIDYAIACDGIHSVVRKKYVPESLPRYSGYTCWRSVIDVIPTDAITEETSESWGPGKRFGIVPITGNRIYWFACVNASANDAGMRALTTADLAERFHDFHSPIPEILRNTRNEDLIWADIIDLKPIRKFAFNNVVLLGDAAHATTPNMGQGACMAIEDAAVLANTLAKEASAPEAFKIYERKRIQRTTKIVNTSRTLGRIAQWENPMLVSFRNALLKMTPSSVSEKQIRFLADVNLV